MSGLLDLSAAELARAIRRGDTTSLEATEAAIARAEATQPATNAFVEPLAARARAQARARDAELRAGRPRGPLHGVPLAHKDCLTRRGARMAVGSAVLSGAPPGEADATVLARLEAAGAVDLGRLHLSEFVAGPTGQNPHLGDCANAWDAARISGGSSSGSGAAVASGAAFGSLGSDTGGSIRIPAAVHGLFGLKPTYGRVSRAGVFPRAHSLDCVGPVARTAEDCALILQAVAGPDEADPTALGAPVPDYAARLADEGAGSRVAALEHEGCAPEVAASLRDAAAALAATESRPFPQLAACDALGDVLSKVEAATLHGAWMAARPERYSAAVFGRTEPGLHIPAPRYLEALATRARVLEEFLGTVMAGVDALLAPCVPVAVPTRQEADMERGDRVFAVVARLTRWTRAFSYLGLPALSVPIGFDREGMPIAAQLVGRPFGEARLLALGARLAREMGWRMRPGLPPRNVGEED